MNITKSTWRDRFCCFAFHMEFKLQIVKIKKNLIYLRSSYLKTDVSCCYSCTQNKLTAHFWKKEKESLAMCFLGWSFSLEFLSLWFKIALVYTYRAVLQSICHDTWRMNRKWNETMKWRHIKYSEVWWSTNEILAHNLADH